MKDDWSKTNRRYLKLKLNMKHYDIEIRTLYFAWIAIKCNKNISTGMNIGSWNVLTCAAIEISKMAQSIEACDRNKNVIQNRNCSKYFEHET